MMKNIFFLLIEEMIGHKSYNELEDEFPISTTSKLQTASTG